MEVPLPTDDSTITDDLLAAAGQGDDKALEKLLTRHRAYLRQVVDVRLEPALRPRVDASDVVQETLLVASRRIDEFIADRPMSFRVWLRCKAIERLVDARRRHLALRRDARRDFTITDASSLAIAGNLLHASSSNPAMRRELAERVRSALGGLSELDQEIILLRHAEGLSNAESAEVLEIDPRAASKRYGRALAHLSSELRRLGFRSL
jgi:RNA polymerase sigma-70 factor (ECF subfamily)